MCVVENAEIAYYSLCSYFLLEALKCSVYEIAVDNKVRASGDLQRCDCQMLGFLSLSSMWQW